MADENIDNEVPETLIKYYECNEYSYDALKNNYLWASHPEQFNDPFDCSPKLWDADSFNLEKINQIIDIGDDPTYREFLKSRDGILKLVHLKTGIICLNSGNTESNDLFWGYYSKQKGFAIELSKDQLTKDLGIIPERVNYFTPDNFEKHICPYSKKEFFEITTKWVKQKKRIWDHEDEFRYVFFNCHSVPSANWGNSETRKKHYSKDAVVKVILGLNFFGECLEVIDEENEAFIYNLTKESNPYHYKLLTYLIDNPKFNIYWMYQNEDLSLEAIPIKLSYLDPWNIIIKIENGEYFYPPSKKTKN